MPDEPKPAPQLLTMRIVHGALCMGVVTITAILGLLRMNGGKPPAATPMISYVGFGMAAVCLPLSFLVPNLLSAGWRRQIAIGKWPLSIPAQPDSDAGWWSIFQSRLIVGMAMLEGAAFMQVIAYFVEGMPLSLGVALGLLVVMLTRFPTRLGVESWIAEQREMVEMLKQDQI
jgi:hypothetical protein